MENKFKVGDVVKCIKGGSGLGRVWINEVFIITELGRYSSNPGVKIDPPEGNTKTGQYNGFIGESSFELVRGANSWSDPVSNKDTFIVQRAGFDKRLLLRKKKSIVTLGK